MEYCRIAPDVKLGRDVRIFAFVNLYGCTIGDNSKVGTFVEIQKNAIIGRNVKISNHTFICEGVQIEDNVFIRIPIRSQQTWKRQSPGAPRRLSQSTSMASRPTWTPSMQSPRNTTSL
jgi:UDP-3-O-[3-hydroxymyristoyl] glucosamine N-acyltransferase